MKRMTFVLPLAVVVGATLLQTRTADSQTALTFRAHDPGVRSGAAGAGAALPDSPRASSISSLPARPISRTWNSPTTASGRR